MDLNWNNIRTLNGSQKDAFEELVVQLAEQEGFENAGKFWRMGKPDAGKECYREVADKIVMWQAKYFTSNWGATQWKEIEESILQILNNHECIQEVILAIPMDMPDGKVPGRKSLLTKWKEKIEEWKKYSSEKNPDIKFTFWGSSELTRKISKPANTGMRFFWFNELEFTNDWFENKNQESIHGLGARYSSELNLDLEIGQIFNGLSRNVLFVEKLNRSFSEALEQYRYLRIKNIDSTVSELSKTLLKQIEEFKTLYRDIKFTGIRPLPLDKMTTSITEISTTINSISSYKYKLQNKNSAIYETNETHYSDKILSKLYSFKNVLTGPACQLANNPFLLVTGGAGMGKSHLLADVVKTRENSNELSLLLLGGSFRNTDQPWTQILTNLLRKSNSDEYEFLGALDAKARSIQKRIIIFIDALNEGEGRIIWPTSLKSFIIAIKKYEWLGLIISIRDTFEEMIAPQSVIDNSLMIRVEHEGFSDIGYKAVQSFFDFYDIIEPAIPFYNPEFYNPLFLKLFCLGLYERRQHSIPPGYEGLNSIIEYFLESINIKLSLPAELDYDCKINLVHRAVNLILEELLKTSVNQLDYERAEEIVRNVFHSNCKNKEPFLKRLISEGIFNDDVKYEKGKYRPVISFAYERFQDHRTASYILDQMEKNGEGIKNLKIGLENFIKDDRNVRLYKNIIDALIIQLPERVGKEFFEVCTKTKNKSWMALGILNSFSWRKNSNIFNATKQYVIKQIITNENLLLHLYNTVLSKAIEPDFYFNADYLHNYLNSLSLTQRDETWSIWLHDRYGENVRTNNAQRLVEWALNEDRKAIVSDESILLCCTVLAWFCSSANRYLRDNATKGIVNLLQHRIHLAPALIEKFKDVNDPYVIERIFCAVYGSCLRGKYSDCYDSLALSVFNQIFNKPTIYANVLLRDYARQIIELTLLYNPKIKINRKQIRPPYTSEALPLRFPTNAEIDKKYAPKEDDGNFGRQKWGNTAILQSMTTEYGRGTARYGDFGRYVFQNAFDDFKIDYNGLSNYAVQRIFELGYDPLIFSEFDGKQGSGRGGGHKERMGKKYQWIVMYELLARVSDQCILYSPESHLPPRKKIEFAGPWSPNVRNIDPSILIQSTKGDSYRAKIDHWSQPHPYANWYIEEKKWVKFTEDIPSIRSILQVIDQQNNAWTWLEIHPDWGEDEILGEDRYASNRKRLWMQLRSYIVPLKELNKLKKSHLKGLSNWELPEARSLSSVFSREYYWSQPFNYFNKPYYSGKDWTVIRDETSGRKACSVHRTTEYFIWESEYDCSKTEPIQFYKPVNLLKDAFALDFINEEGHLIDKSGELICFDPSVNFTAPAGLLIRTDKLEGWLKENQYALVWDVVGQKQILGNNFKKGDYPGSLHFEGLYNMDKKFKIQGTLRYSER